MIFLKRVLTLRNLKGTTLSMFVQVLDQGTMAGWTEQQVAILVAIGRVVHVHGNGVGRGLLLTQRDVIFHAPHFLHQGHFSLDEALKA